MTKTTQNKHKSFNQALEQHGWQIFPLIVIVAGRRGNVQEYNK